MLRVSNVFVTRFYEEWKAAGDAMMHNALTGVSQMERHYRVERVLDAMKNDLAELLLSDINAKNNSPSHTISLDKHPPLS